jgi:transcriptional regulator with XRE-family HTH domain
MQVSILHERHIVKAPVPELFHCMTVEANAQMARPPVKRRHTGASKTVTDPDQRLREQIGRAIVAARTQRHMSAAKLCELSKMDPSSLSRAENGRVIPDLKTILLWADILGVGLDEMLGRTPPVYAEPLGQSRTDPPSIRDAVRAELGPIVADVVRDQIAEFEPRLLLRVRGLIEKASERVEKPQDHSKRRR